MPQPGTSTALPQGLIDIPAALWLLGSLSGFFRQPFDVELVTKRFSPPIDLPTLIEALEALGFKAGLAAWPEAGLPALPLPAVALLAAPAQEADTGTADPAAPPPVLTPALIVQHGEETLAWVRPGQSVSETLSLEDARAQANP